MADQMREQSKNEQAPSLRRIEPVLDQAAANKADLLLKTALKANLSLDIVPTEFGWDPELSKLSNFNYRRKLILAEFFRLAADSLDPEQRENVSLKNLRKAQEKLTEAVNLGVGQMLERLRPREILANQVILWKANSNRADDPALPKLQTSIIVGPNKLVDLSFLKIIDHELTATNQHIAEGEYRSFLFVPLDRLKGGTASLLQYMQKAEKHHMLIVGSLPVADSKDSAPQILRNWKFTVSDVDQKDLERLSYATIVLNNLVIRNPYAKFHEREALSVGLEYAFAAQITKFFKREKTGHWYNPILHPRITAAEMRTVNTVDRLGEWKACVENQLNFAYQTISDQDKEAPGVRIYGPATVFPRGGADILKLGNQAIPFIHAQARVVKNRVFHHLRSLLEKEIGGQATEDKIRNKVRSYLNDMTLQRQIEGSEIKDIMKTETGAFRIKVIIRWSPIAEEFEIDTTGPTPEKADEKK